ncbi:MAG: hypothetical protein Q7S40_24780 [Opitutaceae bacterium]|nr:hypothetical protein [Opitutaceae bacterium]
MLPIVLVSLVVALAVVSVLAIAVFLRAAFWGQQDMTKRGNEVVAWRPPFVHGDPLRQWAATTAEELARNRLAAERTAATAVQLARELEERAVDAMLPLARQAELERIVPCPETGQGMIGLTAPEALAIAADLRQNRSHVEQQRIHDLATANSKAIASRTRGDTALPPLPCPLQGEDNVCCAYAARPLRCRPQHAFSVAATMGSRSVRPAGSPTAGPDGDRHEGFVAAGVAIGFTRALRSAGLDANMYELNSALAIALNTRGAAARWVNGEAIFASAQSLS